jgi:hypothetical protein
MQALASAKHWPEALLMQSMQASNTTVVAHMYSTAVV